MATTVFISPGVYTREQDFTFFASRIGITRLALVGVTLKGPAFEPTKVSTTEEFFKRFGTTDTSLQLPYVANTFLKQSGELTVTRVLGVSGFTNGAAFCITASGSAGANVVVAVIRPKLDTAGTGFISSGGSTDFKLGVGTGSTSLSSFVISATTGWLSATTLTVSMDESKDDYIVKALGTNPLNVVGDYGFYVDRIYPHYIRQASLDGTINIINQAPTIDQTHAATYYASEFTNAVTPYIVGQVIGSTVRDLFRFQTISDGKGSNSEIKVSIANIDLLAKSFDVYVRYYSDNDASSLVQGLERFRACSMDSTSPNFIAKVIGTTDELYPRKSSYITVDMADSYPENVMPAGFRGYTVRRFGGTSAATLYYKTNYQSGDTVAKTYLGISELAYTGFTSQSTTYANIINSPESSMFDYNGASTDATGFTTIKGFHMETTAPTSTFETGQYAQLSAYTKSQRKFTVVPSGGFDGWSPYVAPTFTDSGADVVYVNAFKRAIDKNASSDETDFNVFATPGVNFYDNQGAVRYALTMVETRADALYIIDSPRIKVANTQLSSNDLSTNAVTYLQSTAIDSNYAATYWPWLQMMDANYNKFVYISPTAEVVKAIALTDNVAYPWFAPAGINRGTMSSNIASADVKLTKEDRDTLYEGRINPIATFIQQGIVIYGQKTLQLKASALDRINIRRLLLQVRRLVAAASQTLLFEPNDQSLKDQFLAKVEPLLLQIQNQRGLAAFRVNMEDQANAADEFERNTLRGKIQIKPTYAVEYISLDFQVLPNGASFSDF